MNSPIKIIYKYKNDNRKNQYQYYVFVGSLVPAPIQKVLKKMQELNFFDTLVTLSDKEIASLVNFYGEWRCVCVNLLDLDVINFLNSVARIINIF
jgi:hypothetical protein